MKGVNFFENSFDDFFGAQHYTLSVVFRVLEEREKIKVNNDYKLAA